MIFFCIVFLWFWLYLIKKIMALSMEDFVLYVVVTLVAIVVTYLLCRWIFGINKILYRLRANNEILAEIAKAQGVDPKIIDGILDKYEN